MVIQLLIFIAALLAIFVGLYIKRKFPQLMKGFSKEIPADFFNRYSRSFLILGIIGIPIAILGQFYLSFIYILLLLVLSTVFGLTFAKKI
ncbi:hypothetical protein [Enterococcus sp. BWR-S5]|uniref:hypothetical protein n=1 Tax=Enterococcus sp. BWR-S5 TaxID=2787714 RepID=UPI001924A159|nr:hypothetical protein [Enterococcus sp. BWR-S5]MBL1223970.1 hypothetical protein [Enterococcus sp. BWR-S5]